VIGENERDEQRNEKERKKEEDNYGIVRWK
jgi:hypothetical protein